MGEQIGFLLLVSGFTMSLVKKLDLFLLTLSRMYQSLMTGLLGHCHTLQLRHRMDFPIQRSLCQESLRRHSHRRCQSWYKHVFC